MSSAFVAATPVADIPGKVAALRDAHRAGAMRDLPSRRVQLEQLKRLLVENEGAIVAALEADLCKPQIEAYATEVAFTVSEIDHALRHLEEWSRPQRVKVQLTLKPAQAEIVPQPRGVVLIMSPWNYPFQLTFAPLIGALAAGNTAILKPSDVAPASATLIAELTDRYLDARAVQVVSGGQEEAAALLEERFDHIFLTGSAAAAHTVMAAAARHLTPVTLELGGKCPAIVAADADVEVAARRLAWGKFMNAGQTCVAPDYVLVEEAVEDELLGALLRAVHDFYGDEPSHSPDFARIVNAANHDRLTALLDGGGYDATVTGGDRNRDTLYIAPTVLCGVRPTAAVMQQEIFGPILPVMPVPDVGAAIDYVNGHGQPLSAYVFTRSDATAQRVIEQTTSGSVAVNHVAVHLAVSDLPFGGVGASGFGAYHGEAGFRTFSHMKSVLSKPTRPDPPVLYPPYKSWKTRIVRSLT